MIDNEAFSSIDLVGQCLIDNERTHAFSEAINTVVKPGMKTLDIGTGSGIMAMLSAKKSGEEGGSFAVEYDPYVAKIAKNNIEINNLSKYVTLIECDARDCGYEDKEFDVVTMEMLTTGMVDEYQVQAINNLFEQGAVDTNTKFIPSNQKSFFTLTNYNFEVEGFKFPMITHIWSEFGGEEKIKNISDKELLNDIEFNKINSVDFSRTFKLKIKESGKINSIYLESETVLCEGNSIGYTPSLNGPVIIPIEERWVEKDEVVEIKIAYMFGGGYDRFSIKLI